jgi:hypothetical protein
MLMDSIPPAKDMGWKTGLKSKTYLLIETNTILG